MFKSWKEGEEGVLTYEAAAAKPISPAAEFLFSGFSGEIWRWEHTCLISESQDGQDQTLGSSSKAGPGAEETAGGQL